MRKNEFMPPASPEGHRTRNQVLTFLIEITELSVHYFSGEKAAALAGLAPVARDSGQMRGKRTISSGRLVL